MWFSLFGVVLVLTITFYQGLMGLFTGLINCALAILSAALAFSLYEDVYLAFLVTRQPDYGQAIALVSIFVLSLLALRLLVDAIITGNQQYPVYVDRLAGGLFGFITAMIIVGMLAIGIQMLPFPSTFLGFSRYVWVERESGQPAAASFVETGQAKQAPRSLWLDPDGFTINLVTYLSSSTLTGRNRFADTYPDFLGYLHRARYNPYGQNRQTVAPNAMTVEAYWNARDNTLYKREAVERSSGKFIKLDPIQDKQLEAGTKRLVVRVKLDREAVDTDRSFRFTSEQARLVGQPRSGQAPKEYFPVAINDEQYPNRYVQLYRGQGLVVPVEDNNEFDFVFEVEKDFKPLFIEYKQNARVNLESMYDKSTNPPVALKGPESKDKKDKGDKNAQAVGSEGSPTPRRKPTDRVHGVDIADTTPFFGKELPFEITNYSGSSISQRGGELRGGQFTTELDDDWSPTPGSQSPIRTLEVPDNQRLLHLFVDKLQPESWLGNILGRATDKVRNIYLIDDRSQTYMPVGSYALATVGRKKMFEIFYLDESQRGFARFPEFERIRPQDLRGKYSYVFLFHVPPGTRAAKFNTGRTKLDLTPFDLVAPQ